MANIFIIFSFDDNLVAIGVFLKINTIKNIESIAMAIIPLVSSRQLIDSISEKKNQIAATSNAKLSKINKISDTENLIL